MTHWTERLKNGLLFPLLRIHSLAVHYPPHALYPQSESLSVKNWRRIWHGGRHKYNTRCLNPFSNFCFTVIKRTRWTPESFTLNEKSRLIHPIWNDNVQNRHREIRKQFSVNEISSLGLFPLSSSSGAEVPISSMSRERKVRQRKPIQPNLPI